MWVGLTKRARILVYNKDKVKPEELSTYEALTEDKWKGRVLVRSSESVYNQSLLASFIEIKVKRKRKNGRKVSSITLPKILKVEIGTKRKRLLQASVTSQL